ncbi:MAG: LacI family transcriptional regulator [Meiothermus sp.]
MSDPSPSSSPKPIPTIRDVAKAAGVSLGTASKALSGQGQLREETRQHVRSVAERLGYFPNDLFHSIRRKRSFTVGLISTDSYGRFSIPLLEGIEHALGEAQISVFLCNAKDDPVLERQHVESLLAKRVDGIIVTSRRTDPRPSLDLRGAKIPVLYAYAQVDDPAALCLLPDDAQGGYIATGHLLRLGRRNVAHITGPERFGAARERLQGMQKALREHGLKLSKHRILHGAWSEAWGYQAVRELLQRDPKIDALFCGSDLIARGALDALRESGVRVPEDLAVVGFDNWEILAEAARPPLTSVDMNLLELGRQAGRRLLRMIDGRNEPGVQRLPCRLVVRASCGSPLYYRKEGDAP